MPILALARSEPLTRTVHGDVTCLPTRPGRSEGSRRKVAIVIAAAMEAMRFGGLRSSFDVFLDDSVGSTR